MKPRLLICTIMRNQCENIHTWAHQLYELMTGTGLFGVKLHEGILAHYDVELAVYENDSTDNTAINLYIAGYTWIDTRWVLSENLGTQSYGSIWNLDRIRNLANARQRCMELAGDLSRFQKIAFIEPDVTYSSLWIRELILARHPIAAGLGEPDIYSGWSLRSGGSPKESVFLYDTCATRQNSSDIAWNFEREGKWRDESLIPTHFSQRDSNCLHRVWSTFNCFCVYNAKPFIEGARWGWVNTRLNTGQEYIRTDVQGEISYLDADTSVMCETFRARGYSKIFLNTNCLVRHV